VNTQPSEALAWIEDLLEERAARERRRTFVVEHINEGGHLLSRSNKGDRDLDHLDWRIDHLIGELEDVVEAHLEAERLTRLRNLAFNADDFYSHDSPVRHEANRLREELAESSKRATDDARKLSEDNRQKLVELALWVMERKRLQDLTTN